MTASVFLQQNSRAIKIALRHDLSLHCLPCLHRLNWRSEGLERQPDVLMSTSRAISRVGFMSMFCQPLYLGKSLRLCRTLFPDLRAPRAILWFTMKISICETGLEQKPSLSYDIGKLVQFLHDLVSSSKQGR